MALGVSLRTCIASASSAKSGTGFTLYKSSVMPEKGHFSQGCLPIFARRRWRGWLRRNDERQGAWTIATPLMASVEEWQTPAPRSPIAVVLFVFYHMENDMRHQDASTRRRPTGKERSSKTKSRKCSPQQRYIRSQSSDHI